MFWVGMSSAVLTLAASLSTGLPTGGIVRDELRQARHALDDYWGRAHQFNVPAAVTPDGHVCPYCMHRAANGSGDVSLSPYEGCDAPFGCLRTFSQGMDASNEDVAGRYALDFAASLTTQAHVAASATLSAMRSNSLSLFDMSAAWVHEQSERICDFLRRGEAMANLFDKPVAVAPHALFSRPHPPEPLDDAEAPHGEVSVLKPPAGEVASESVTDPLSEKFADAVREASPSPLEIEPVPPVASQATIADAEDEPAVADSSATATETKAPSKKSAVAIFRGAAILLDEVANAAGTLAARLHLMADQDQD